ncbi:MAG: hypothetical protein GY862_38515 [Gammaproteobacteria bacterium]|nr:hypothetical protein [Gammaproteobacteria bacterium]
MKIMSLFNRSIVSIIALTAIAVNVHGNELNMPDNIQEGWGRITEGFQLSVRVKKKKFYIGEAVSIQIFTRNASEDVLYFIEDDPRAFRVVVKDSQGNTVPMTRVGKAVDSRYKRRYGIEKGERHEAHRTIIVKLAPGQEVPFHPGYDANLHYDMTLSGTYLIAVKRHLPKKSPPGRMASSRVEVTSNFVEVSVVPAN